MECKSAPPRLIVQRLCPKEHASCCHFPAVAMLAWCAKRLAPTLGVAHAYLLQALNAFLPMFFVFEHCVFFVVEHFVLVLAQLSFFVLALCA